MSLANILFFFINKIVKKNILECVLEKLNIQYTPNFTTSLMLRYPNSDNRLSVLSKMLAFYNVKSGIVSIDIKNEMLREFNCPFVAQLGPNNIVVLERLNNDISCFLNGKYFTMSYDKFIDNWTGLTLLIEKTDDSQEPNFESNFKRYVLEFILNCVLLFSCIVLMIVFFKSLSIEYYCIFFICFIINSLGVFLSILLLIKQLSIGSSFAELVCKALNKQHGCDSVLNTKVAKICELISWSEIGLGYFSVNIVLLFSFSETFFYVLIFNSLALPFSVWSIYYQKKILRQWCTLCLCIQFVLWLLWGININNISLFTLSFNPYMFVYVLIIYIVVILFINRLVYFLSINRKLIQSTKDYNELRLNKLIFNTLLFQQKFYAIEKNELSIILGDRSAVNMITIISNPFCTPCAIVHFKISQLIKFRPDFCVQYLFYSFSENLKYIDELLTSLYFVSSNKEIQKIYDEWFSTGRKNPKDFIQKYSLNEKNIKLNVYKSQTEWIIHENIVVTPTILVNGYKIPLTYTIDDILLIDFDE